MGNTVTRQPRFRRPRVRQWLALGVVLVATILRVGWIVRNPAPAPLTEGEHSVQRIIDGDTLLLTTGHRIRLQGVDTPELAHHDQPQQPYAQQASTFTQAFVEEAEGRVRVAFTDERLDRYGRTLAFLWHGEVCLNEELVREGLAKARLDYRFSGTMRSRLRDAQQSAQTAGKGIWAKP